MEQLTIQPGNPGGPDARRLIEELDSYLNSLYPAENNHLLSVEALQQPNVTFLIARINGKPVGCGAFVNHGKYAEIKRMFVSPDLRGKGIGRRIMDELETHARLDGLPISRLETGVSQPAALKLYEHCGYLRRGPFPPYSNDPQSVFMEKKLTRPE
jgi:putative acetyltransferase